MTIFNPIRHERSAREVAHQVEGLILEGVLRVGDQLPGEREIAAAMDVSRPIVREAIKQLEADGLLESRHGGGTFVADVIGTVFSPQVSRLLAAHERATADFLEYRREIESMAARLAAERSTQADREQLGRLVQRMEDAAEAEDFETEARADVEFHSAIGEMAHNLVLLHTLRACYRLLSEGVFQNRARLYRLPGGRQRLLDQHKAIALAIIAGNAAEAEAEARGHLDYVIAATADLERREERERIAELRLAMRNVNDGRARNRDGVRGQTGRI